MNARTKQSVTGTETSYGTSAQVAEYRSGAGTVNRTVTQTNTSTEGRDAQELAMQHSSMVTKTQVNTSQSLVTSTDVKVTKITTTTTTKTT